MSDYDEGFRAAARELMVRAINKATGLRDDFRCEESYAIADGLLPPAPSETAATIWDRLLFRHSAGGPLLGVADVREVVRLAKLALPTDWARVARDELKRIERGEPNSLGQVSTAKRGRKR